MGNSGFEASGDSGWGPWASGLELEVSGLSRSKDFEVSGLRFSVWGLGSQLRV